MTARKLSLLAFLGLLCVLLAALSVVTRSADAAGAPCFDQLPGLPGVIPPWGFHTSDPLTGARGTYARAYGDINLDANQISGTICQVQFRHAQEQLIVMRALSPIIYHTHHAVLYGSPGNLIKAHVRVISSTDASCKVNSTGVMTMYGSYDNVRKDSIQFTFPAACRAHDHLYGPGPQVNAQVPPL
jgi:hypothetical protein